MILRFRDFVKIKEEKISEKYNILEKYKYGI